MIDKNISKIKEYAKQQSIEDTIGMILSNRVDYGGGQGGMVSVKQFNQVAKDLIEIFPQLKAAQVQAKEEVKTLKAGQVEPKVKVNLADIKEEFDEKFVRSEDSPDRDSYGERYIDEEPYKVWQWFEEKLKAITTL